MRPFSSLAGTATGALILVALAAPAAHAQVPPVPPASASTEREPLDPRTNQRIERIVHEDTRNRIEEIRVGGRTERITVQPKGGFPAYEVQTAAQRPRRDDARDGSTTGDRALFNLLRF